MKKQWKRLAALSSAVVMAAGTLLYFPTDTLQNISWGITASAENAGAETEAGTQTWKEGNLTWTLELRHNDHQRLRGDGRITAMMTMMTIQVLHTRIWVLKSGN